MTKFFVVASQLRDLQRQRLHRIVLGLVRHLLRWEREDVIEGHRSESAGNLSFRGTDETFHGHDRGAIGERPRETDRRPKNVFLITVCNLLDSDVAFFPSIARRHANTARPVPCDSATSKGSCGFQELAPGCHIALAMLTP